MSFSFFACNAQSFFRAASIFFVEAAACFARALAFLGSAPDEEEAEEDEEPDEERREDLDLRFLPSFFNGLQ